jgi:hypothetical protein
VTASRAPKHLTKDKTNAIPRYPVRENITARPYVLDGCWKKIEFRKTWQTSKKKSESLSSIQLT